ncbi:hypothetical protein J2769_000977 [Acinetobacter guillouiae]|nr:hypothetical protein [Acinetobacter guillouiae]BAP36445.1 hypothetical protein AS4_15050 [Acinetobacter guillouiae]
MKKIHFKLSFIILLIFIHGCTTNDSNSFLVRWWNDGFVYSEKKSDANQDCSYEANRIYTDLKPGDTLWESIYSKCMKKKGY